MKKKESMEKETERERDRGREREREGGLMSRLSGLREDSNKQ